MSRFLNRALSAVRAEVVLIARSAPASEPPEPSFGDFGGFGERAENENAPPPTSPPARFDWPEGVDYWLTHDAVKLAGILKMGGTARWCPSGGLDVWQADGRYVGFSPYLVARLSAAELLAEGLPERASPMGRGACSL